MISVGLTRGKEALIDNCDQDLIDGRGWLASMNTHSLKNYAYRRDLGARKDKRSLRYMHRVILERSIGRKLKKGEHVDHINGNSLDNRRSNLRVANAFQNHANTRSIRSKTGYKGVVQYDDKFVTFCGIKGGPRYVGTFSSAEDAARAYDFAAKARAGEFAATNEELLCRKF